MKELAGLRQRTALLFALFLELGSPTMAQIQSNLEFEVASVKPVKECAGQRFRNTRGSLEVLSMQPTVMIRNAYRLVMEGQITGFPSWADQDCFDIEAKAEEDPGIELREARERNLLRLQSLLVSRFQLRCHWQSGMQRGYVLAVGKKGLRLKLSEPGSARQTRQGRGTLFCTSCSISALAGFLSNFLKKPVQDETGIQGSYDFNFAFEPLDAAPSSDSGLPSLFTVLEDELGLTLKPRKIVVQTLVVDHLGHPSSN